MTAIFLMRFKDVFNEMCIQFLGNDMTFFVCVVTTAYGSIYFSYIKKKKKKKKDEDTGELKNPGLPRF